MELSEEMPDKMAELCELLEKHRKNAKVQMPQPNPKYQSN
jgi:hypothetical protein